MYKNHAELQQYHYQALKNSAYQVEGMMNVLYEEMMMNMSVYREQSEPILQKVQPIQMTNITKDAYEQQQGLILFLKGKLESHITKEVSSKKKKVSRYD